MALENFVSTKMYILVGIVGLILIFRKKNQPNLRSIPAAGSSGFLSSWLSALRFSIDSQSIIKEGYEQFQGSVFKLPKFDRWLVIVSNPKHILELVKAPDDHISITQALAEELQIDYTVDPSLVKDIYIRDIIQGRLTRNLPTLFSDLKDELVASFEDNVILQKQGWTPVPVLDTMARIVCRTNNRLLVGLPLCQNQDYLSLSINFTADVIKSSVLISFFPWFLRPLAGRFFGNERNIRCITAHLKPVIDQYTDELGKDWADKPNTLLSWMIDDVQGEEIPLRTFALRVLMVNLAGTHTASMSLTHAIFDLASRPEYIQPLREEIETITRKEGWTKVAVNKMIKLDSFLKESQRYTGLTSLSVNRKTLKPFTFSDGTYIPAGTYLNVPISAIHHDEERYPNANSFDGFRFAKLRQIEGQSHMHYMVAANTQSLHFGIGRHTCPGRFLAATEIKTTLAHILLTYDIKFENEGVRPPNLLISGNIIPNPKANVLFRARET